MQRRRFVAALGAACATGLAGCGDDEPSDGTETPTATHTPGSDDPEDWQATFRAALESDGLEVTHVDVADPRLVVDYETETTERGDLIREMESVATAYGEVVAQSWEVETAELWVLDPEIDDPQSKALCSYLVRNEWALAWKNDETSTSEFMEQVLNTVELYESYAGRYGEPTPTPDGGDGGPTPTPDGGEGTPTGTETGDGTPTGTATASTTTDAAE